MPVESVPETDLKYYLIAFDEEGQERTDDPDGQMSQRVLEVLKTEPITDIFLTSHGWRSDVPAARRQYNRWMKMMAEQKADLDHVRDIRPNFSPLLIGLHWPSLPWGDYDLAQSSAISYGLRTTSRRLSIRELVDQYASRLVDTPKSRQALETILLSAQRNIAPKELPPEVIEAYRVLDAETNPVGQDLNSSLAFNREPFDPESTFLVARQEALSFSGFSWGGVLAPLRTLSFWRMKDRARQFGENAGHDLLKNLQQINPDLRFHLIGHSFGCIVLSGMLAGQQNWGVLERPVNSLFLIQGALSYWSYCPDIPVAPGVSGYFHPLIAEGKVSGSIITTYSKFDTALYKWYPLAATASSLFTRSVSFYNFDEFPTHGALGAFGARGGDDFWVVDMDMLDKNSPYPFYPGQIYNLDSREYIREGSGAEGAHNDFVRPEVAHAVWQAAIYS
ncbi:MAG: hypothetical protein SWJ54_07345 [Cyanobacteriota bacterium]|nr:hypothetical protein [Cyanobacteriota bacterium]